MSQVVVRSQPDEYKQEIIAGTHVIWSDAPEAVGGKLAGPDPHELLLASLGACTSITIQMFAKRRGWDLQQVYIKLSEEKVVDPNEPTVQLSRITRDIDVKGTLNDEQIAALKGAADKCLIHKLLVGPKTIETTVRHSG
ncbi:MAG: OsmC family protein [Candidatus Melainabacteria bacterium]|nr:OsmC family protein [Candidatus Melainabacteria bacterium]